MASAKRNPVIEILGWIGMILILLSYALISFEIVAPRSFAYQAMAGLGSLGLVISSYYKKDYQPLVLNLIWVIIALTVVAQLW
jgi:hypothetical protein